MKKNLVFGIIIIAIVLLTVGGYLYFEASINQQNIVENSDTYVATSSQPIDGSSYSQEHRCDNASDKDRCLTGFAIKEKDIKICNQAPDKEFCVGTFGAIIGDISACDSLAIRSNTQTKEICYEGVAAIKKDISICLKITKPLNKDGCYLKVAVATKDVTMCKTYFVNSDYVNETMCYMRMAKSANDSSICENIKNSDRQGCIDWVEKDIDPYAMN